MNQYQFSAPPLTKINKFIILSTGICFLLYSILKAVGAFNLVSLLGLSGSGLMSGFIFQLVTYPFMETQLMGFIFNSLVVWFIGSELEAQWGRKVYLRFLLINLIVVGLIFVLINTVFFFGTGYYSITFRFLSLVKDLEKFSLRR